MVTIEQLFIFAMGLNIEVKFRNLRKMHPDLLGMADASNRTIALDQTLNQSPRQLRCVFAEEIGHIMFPPRPGHIRYHSKQYIEANHIDRSIIQHTVAQDERKALQWATGFLMPNVEFWQAVEEGANTVISLNDWFDVETWFTHLKIGFIRRQVRDDGWRLRWRDVIRRG